MNRKAVVAGTLSLVVSISLVFIGCSGGGGSGTAGPGTLTGIVDLGAAAFHVAAGETVWCVGDVTIRAGSALIEGALLSQAVTGNGTNGSDITLETPGDIVVTGRVVAGSGTAGAAEGKGGDGGDVTLRSTAGGITIGTGAAAAAVKPKQAAATNVSAGDAANGGGGIYGGAGGVGGTVTLDCNAGTLTLHQAPGLLHVGNGGGGGNAVIVGDSRATYQAPEAPRNNGGRAGDIVPVCHALVGVEVHPVAEPTVGGPERYATLDDGVGSGGEGGGGGDVYFGEAPATADTSHTRASAVRTRAITQQPPPVRGGAGDNGPYRGGPGGDATQLFGAADVPRVALARGWEAIAEGGPGGKACVAEYGSLAQYALSLFTNPAAYGGAGGNARAVGGPGASGAPGQPGGPGGEASATGGNGGLGVGMGDCRTGPGGDAYAVSGPGGDGGADCGPPPGPGGEGGIAGYAYAYGGHSIGAGASKGGDATATMGRPGNGGDGIPPGAAGYGQNPVAQGGDGNPYGTAATHLEGPAAPGANCPTAGKHKISGRVTASFGMPFAGTTVGWSRWTTSTSGRAESLADDHGEVTTNSDGRYEIPNMDDGTYWVEPEHKWQLPLFWNPPMRMITVAGADLPNQDFGEATATTTFAITIHVQTAAGAPVAGEAVKLVKQGDFVHEQATDAAGDAVFSSLWPGVYSGLPPSGTSYAYTPFQLVFPLAGHNLQGVYTVTPK